MGPNRWPLREVVTRLEGHHGRPARPMITDPFDMAVQEAVAYLVPDVRRDEVFATLRGKVGLAPPVPAATPRARLAQVIARGGMQPLRRAEKIRMAADVAIEVGQEELRRLCRRDPTTARKILVQFPGIGEPGADRILLFNRGNPGLAPDSNGLRVLNRLGFGADAGDYRKTYRGTAAAVAAELPADFDWMIRAHQLLRRHGQDLCTRNAPRCSVCPLAERCPARR